MDFVPDGWLRSFSEAAELYDKLRFDERPTSGGEPEARILTLKKKQGDGKRLTDDEQKEVTHLEDEYWLMQMLQFFGVTFGEQHRENKGKLIHDARRWRQADSTKRLQQRLFDEDVRASIQDRNTGELHPLPGRFWASEQAEAMINGEKGLGRVGLALLRSVDYSVRIDAFRTALGPVRICREDVIRAARPASDPPDEALVPKQVELKKDYILRALNMKEVRSISAKEGRELAPFWLKAKGFPCAPEDIAAESRRMTSLMSGLARPQDGKPKRTKLQAVAKSPRSRSKVRAKSVRSNSE
jgi:hypothetical protein